MEEAIQFCGKLNVPSFSFCEIISLLFLNRSERGAWGRLGVVMVGKVLNTGTRPESRLPILILDAFRPSGLISMELRTKCY